MKKAVIFGASGFVGSNLLEQLLMNDEYVQVTALFVGTCLSTIQS